MILEVNSAFAAVVDRPKESIPGKRLRNLYPGLGPKWLRKCAEIMEKGVSERLELYSGALGGWFEFLVSPLAGGKFGVMLTDISERKEMENCCRRAKAGTASCLKPQMTVFGGLTTMDT